MNTSNEIRNPLLQPRSWFKRGIHCIYEVCIAPRSKNEDDRRPEFVLNALLCGIVPLFVLLDCFVAYSSYEEGARYRGFPFLYFSLLIMLFAALLVISRKGHYRLASFILLGLYFVTTTYGAVQWGVELPLVAISYIVMIVISSLLISTRFAFFTTTFIAITIICICLLQAHNVIQPRLYWKYTPVRVNDAVELSAVFFLVTIVSWLSNREMERSLTRARASEGALIEERNLLEIKVEERTKELKETQEEKIGQLYRFAEFGGVGGVFHDLMNSLQGVVSSVSRLEDTENILGVKNHLATAVGASKRMGSYMETVRKQIITDDAVMTFSLQKEIQDAIDILQYHAREANVSMTSTVDATLQLHGNPIKFYQIVFNLLANAIDACNGHAEPGIIAISLTKNATGENMLLTIDDNGCGIDAGVIGHIFNSFFTTKHRHKGMGIGLSQTKDFIEKEFNGSISVSSTPGSGSIFTVIFPIPSIVTE